jgi:hypothetical protein
MSETVLELHPKAENYTQAGLAKIDINIGPVGAAYRGIINEVRSVLRQSKNFSAIYLEGLYGSGKTLVLRKVVYDIISGPQKAEFEKVFPIYFYLGEMDFKLFQGLKSYIEDLIAYTTSEGAIPTKPNIMGEAPDWKSRLPLLQELSKVISEVEKRYKEEKEKELIGFFEILKELNKRGFYPLLIFDEFERVIYTGDGLRTEGGKEVFARFASMYLELTRGHIYNGIFVISTTQPIENLIDPNRPHIREIFAKLGISKRDDFPMIRPHIVYDYKDVLRWISADLDILAQKYGLKLHRELLHLISMVLPTPRAVIQIDRKIRTYLGKTPDVVTPRELYNIVQLRIADLIERLKREKIGRTHLITPRTRWHEKFLKLLEEGCFIVKGEKYDEVAKVLGFAGEDPKKIRQKVSQTLYELSNVGLYESLGAGEYRLSPYMLAYALEIERLPDGSWATLDELVNKIKQAIKEIREKQRKRREEKQVVEQEKAQ